MAIIKKIKDTFWMAKRNLIIDVKFLFRTPHLSIFTKISILYGKYYSLFYHCFANFKTGEDSTYANGQYIYYNTKYGLVGYQSVMCEQIYWASQLTLSSKASVIDIGANVGYFTLGIKHLLPQSTVYAFEPAPPAFIALQKNIRKLEQVNLYNFALGAENKTVSLNIDYEQTSFSKIDNEGTNTKVALKTLDSVKDIEDLSIVDLIKLDTEGYELNVLKGAVATLRKTRYLLMEINTDEYPITKISDILKEAGKNMKLLFIRNFNLDSDGEFKNGDVLFELTDL